MPFVPGKKYRVKQMDGTYATLTKGKSTNSIVKKAVRKARNSAFAKQVLKVVNRREETKYAAETITVGTGVGSSAVTPAQFYRLVTAVGQGVAENQRIGDRINPTRARAIITYYLASTPNMFDVTLNCVIVNVKGAQTAATVAAVPAGVFLKVGNGLNVDPADPNQTNMLTLVNHFPVNNDQYSVLRWYKKRFAKGAGALNGATAGNEAGQGANTPSKQVVSFSWKPPTLKYDDAAATQPTNHYPVLLTWATANDGSALQNILFFSIRSEMYFKDA